MYVYMTKITWNNANFTWNLNSFTWDEIQLVEEIIQRGGGNIEDDMSWMKPKKKKKLIKLILKIKGKTLTESKTKSIKQYKIKAEDVRLVVETKDYSLLFNGSINSNGKCEIPIRKLKGLIDEDTSGNIRLEVIAEDTFFTPWQSDFEVETSRKVTVEVKTQTTQKPILEAKATIKPQQVTKSEKKHVVNLFKLLIKEDINIDNISYKRNELNNIVATYLKENTVNNTEKVINGVLRVLESKK